MKKNKICLCIECLNSIVIQPKCLLQLSDVNFDDSNREEDHDLQVMKFSNHGSVFSPCTALARRWRLTRRRQVGDGRKGAAIFFAHTANLLSRLPLMHTVCIGFGIIFL